MGSKTVYFKCCLTNKDGGNQEIHRFALDNAALNYSNLRTKICDSFPKLIDSFSIIYIGNVNMIIYR